MKGESNCCLKKGKNTKQGDAVVPRSPLGEEQPGLRGRAGAVGSRGWDMATSGRTVPDPSWVCVTWISGDRDPGSSGGRSCESRDPTAHARRVQDGGAALPAWQCPPGTARVPARPGHGHSRGSPSRAQRDPGSAPDPAAATQDDLTERISCHQGLCKAGEALKCGL